MMKQKFEALVKTYSVIGDTTKRGVPSKNLF